MRKIFKILLVVVIIAVVSLCINNVFADNRPEVIKYERDYDTYNGEEASKDLIEKKEIEHDEN